MLRKIFPYLLLAYAIVGCKTTKTTKINPASAQIIKEGFINCFEKDLAADGAPVWCETSAILYDGKNILFANDKDMPGKKTFSFLLEF